MSHYKVKSATIKTGSLVVTIASSNVIPTTYWREDLSDWGTLNDQLIRFGRGIWGGDFQFLPSARGPIARAARRAQQLVGDWRDPRNPDWRDLGNRSALENRRTLFAEKFTSAILTKEA